MKTYALDVASAGTDEDFHDNSYAAIAMEYAKAERFEQAQKTLENIIGEYVRSKTMIEIARSCIGAVQPSARTASNSR